MFLFFIFLTWYLPVAQGVQTEASACEYLPAAQLTQAEEETAPAPLDALPLAKET